MLTIDGSIGEGGGQILRSSLALSMLTGIPFRLDNIRASRERPGLQRQHLTAVRAAIEVCGADAAGAVLESSRIDFKPGVVRPGQYTFAVGSAGSASLVLQTVLPALITATGPSELVLEGGTHNSKAPPFDFLARTFLPLLNRMGPRVSVILERPGFYPKGGGRMRVWIEPALKLARLDLTERGSLQGVRARALVAQVPVQVADRELAIVNRELRGWNPVLETEVLENSAGPGNVLLLELDFANVVAVVSAFGEKGRPAEAVAREACAEARRLLESEAAVGEHLADQLMLPFALAGGGAFLTVEPSLHSRTNLETLAHFLPVRHGVTPRGRGCWFVELQSD